MRGEVGGCLRERSRIFLRRLGERDLEPAIDEAIAFLQLVTDVEALRRNLASDSDEFPLDVQELLDYLSDDPQQAVRAVPGKGMKVPLWILGSSLYGAQVAAALASESRSDLNWTRLMRGTGLASLAVW